MKKILLIIVIIAACVTAWKMQNTPVETLAPVVETASELDIAYANAAKKLTLINPASKPQAEDMLRKFLDTCLIKRTGRFAYIPKEQCEQISLCLSQKLTDVEELKKDSDEYNTKLMTIFDDCYNQLP